MTNNIAQLPQLPQAGFYNPCKGSLCIVEPQYAENLCVNPSFEIDTYNWSGGTLSLVQNPWSGANSLRNTAGGTITYGATVPLTLTASSMYAFSFYVYFPSTTTNTTITVTVLDAGAGQRARWTQSIAPQQWTRFTGSTLIAPASASFTFTIAVSAGITIDIDAVQVELDTGYGATTYLDGTLSGFINEGQVAVEQYSWSGQPHQSTSNRATTVSSGGRIIDLSARYGWNLIGVMNADNPAPSNQTVTYSGSDGASLQDIIIPNRTIAFVGRISAPTQRELNQKISFFQSHFARDKVAYRQQRAFIFQHSNGDDYIGIPMTFSGVIEGSMQFPLTNSFEAQFAIQITMLDPFFYGHDMSRSVDGTQELTTTKSMIYAPNYTIRNDSSVADGGYHKVIGSVNADVEAIVEIYDGRIFFAGNFTTVGATSYAYIAVFNPATGTVSGIGATPSTVFNGRIRTMCTTIDRKGIYIGGDFTTANGVAANRIVYYNTLTGVFSAMGAGNGFNGSVYTIVSTQEAHSVIGGIVHGRLLIGGSFTAGAGGLAMFRIAYADSTVVTGGAYTPIGAGNGMNNTVYTIALDNINRRAYVGGLFDTSNGGVAGAYPNIFYFSFDIGWTTPVQATLSSGFADQVRAIYVDSYNNLVYVGGQFNATTTGTTIWNLAVYQNNLFRQVDIGYGAGALVMCRSIAKYRNGLIIGGRGGTKTYNGQVLIDYPSNCGFEGYLAFLESSNGYLYLCPSYNTANGNSNGDLLVIDSDTTANCPVKIAVMNYGTATLTTAVYYVSNETQQTSTNVIVQAYNNQTVTVDFTTGSIINSTFGSVSGFSYGAGITTLRVVPGKNFIQVRTGNVGTGRLVYVIWKQTFNSIFDGIRTQ